MCGLVNPSLPHLLWNCASTKELRKEAGVEIPKERAGERLLCPMLRPRPIPAIRCSGEPGPNPGMAPLAAAVARAWGVDGSTVRHEIVLASDGAANPHCRDLGVYAVATANIVVSGLVEGADGGPYAAELEGVRQTVQTLYTTALELSGIGPWRALLLVDCQAAISFAKNAAEGKETEERAAIWLELKQHQQALRSFGVRLRIGWVPSHGKQAGWVPDFEGVSAAEARRLNKQADEVARDVLQNERLKRGFKQWEGEYDEAAARASKTLNYAAAVGMKYQNFLRSRPRFQEEAECGAAQGQAAQSDPGADCGAA